MLVAADGADVNFGRYLLARRAEAVDASANDKHRDARQPKPWLRDKTHHGRLHGAWSPGPQLAPVPPW